MTDKRTSAPKPQFMMLPRELLRSDAWRSMGVNERRLLDFLMLEHMRHGGRQNGNLKAPRQQLRIFGIGSRFISGAIAAVEERALIRCKKGGMRVATTYALTWLATADGTKPSNAWQSYRDASLPPMPEPKSKNLGHKGNPGLGHKGNPDCPNLGHKGNPDAAESLGHKGNHPYREASYQGGAEYSVLGVGPAGPAASAPPGKAGAR